MDTCIVSGLARNDLKEAEFDSLMSLLKKYKDGLIHITTSEVTIAEIKKIPIQFQTQHNIIYNLISNVPTAQKYNTNSGLTLMGCGGGSTKDVLYVALENILPDKEDAEHIFQAIKNNATHFLTTDEKTIIKFKKDIENLAKISIMTPSQLINALEFK